MSALCSVVRVPVILSPRLPLSFPPFIFLSLRTRTHRLYAVYVRRHTYALLSCTTTHTEICSTSAAILFCICLRVKCPSVYSQTTIQLAVSNPLYKSRHWPLSAWGGGEGGGGVPCYNNRRITVPMNRLQALRKPVVERR